jgi:hypothetical protein
MEFDTRGFNKNNNKRNNLREKQERQYRKDQRFEQGQFEAERIVEIGGSTKKMQDEKKPKPIQKKKEYYMRR